MGKKFKGMYMQKCGLRDGSLVPVTALLAHGLTDSSLKYHLQNAKNHGVTQKEIAAVGYDAVLSVDTAQRDSGGAAIPMLYLFDTAAVSYTHLTLPTI